MYNLFVLQTAHLLVSILFLFTVCARHFRRVFLLYEQSLRTIIIVHDSFCMEKIGNGLLV